jgi:hypothetical protein
MARLTRDDLEDGYQNEEWGGYGYLGERTSLTPAQRRKADAAILAVANREGWSKAKLFKFTNSRASRHYADSVSFGENQAKLEHNIHTQYVPWAQREGHMRARGSIRERWAEVRAAERAGRPMRHPRAFVFGTAAPRGRSRRKSWWRGRHPR